MVKDSEDVDIKQFEQELCWALDRIAMWGWSADPHVRYEAKMQAKTALSQLVREIDSDSGGVVP